MESANDVHYILIQKNFEVLAYHGQAVREDKLQQSTRVIGILSPSIQTTLEAWARYATSPLVILTGYFNR